MTQQNSVKDNALVGFAVQVLTGGDLHGTLMLHRALYSMDNNWPYITVAQGKDNKITLTGALPYEPDKIDIEIVNQMLYYNSGARPIITPATVKKCVAWLNKHLPYTGDKVEVIDIKFVPFTKDSDADWAFGYEDDLFLLPDAGKMEPQALMDMCLEKSVMPASTSHGESLLVQEQFANTAWPGEDDEEELGEQEEAEAPVPTAEGAILCES